MKKNNKENLAQKIKIYMLKNGISQRDLAKKMKITPAAVSKFLTGDNAMRTDTLDRISAALGVADNYFFDNSTAVNGNNNVVGEKNTINPNLKEEIALIKKELEVHRYQIENIVLKLEKIQKQKWDFDLGR